MLIHDVLVSRFTALCHLLSFPSECFFFSACPLVAAPLKGVSHFLLQPSITNVGQDLLGTSSYHARMQNLDMAWPLQCWTHSNYFLITVPWYADLKQMRDTLSVVFCSHMKTPICLFFIFISLLSFSLPRFLYQYLPEYSWKGMNDWLWKYLSSSFLGACSGFVLQHGAQNPVYWACSQRACWRK